MKWVCALLLIGAAGAASAQSAEDQPAEDQRGFYIGANAGVASYPGRPRIVLGDFTLHAAKMHEDDLSWSVIGGYRFGKHFALEAGYLDLGEATAEFVDSGGSDLRTDLRWGARGETISALVLFPIGQRWEPYLKLGALRQNVDLRLDGTQSGTPFRLSSSADRELKLYWGTGVNYRFDSHWKASLGVDFFSDLGDADRTGRARIRSTFLGISYRF